MGRAISVNQLLNTRRKVLPFGGEWLESFGRIELKGTIFIHGHSGHGKTSYVLQLCKYLTHWARVAYNSLEEGDSETMRLAFVRNNMQEVGRKLILLDQEPIEELSERLLKHKSPDVIVIDSLQYSGITYTDYKLLKAKHPNKLWIIISHTDGLKPAGMSARKVMYDASVKVYVEGYTAYVTSRYKADGEKVPHVIWKEQADKFNAVV